MRVASFLKNTFNDKESENAYEQFLKVWDEIELREGTSILAFTETQKGRVLLTKHDGIFHVLVKTFHPEPYGAIYEMKTPFMVFDKYVSSVRLLLTLEHSVE